MNALRSALAVLVCSGIATAAEPAPLPIDGAYYDGQSVQLAFERTSDGQKSVRVGPWLLGARVNDHQPREKRLNLYVVFPGTQHRAEGHEEFDHNLIINVRPTGENHAEWDVYWAVVLDPGFTEDLRGEQDLLHAAQETFFPGDLLEFEDIPGRAPLREFLKVDSLRGLAKYRRKDGRLPRILIVPSSAAVRAAVVVPAPASLQK